MVEDRITDSTRIAQFLASELSGLEQGPLAGVEVVEADPDAEPAPSGTRAYRVASGGRAVASVVLFPDAVEVRLADREWQVPGSATAVAVDGATLEVGSAAAVKQVTDCLEATLDDA